MKIRLSNNIAALRRALDRSLLVALLCVAIGTTSVAAQEEMVTIDGHPVHPTRVLARFKAEVQTASAVGALSQAGATVDRRYRTVEGLVALEDTDVGAASVLSIEAKRERLLNRIQNLRNTGLFEYVEPNYLLRASATPNDLYFTNGELWGLQNTGQFGGISGADIGATAAWDVTTGSTNVIVAVIDTGIRYTHLDLTNQMWRNPNPGGYGQGIENDIYGINAVARNGDPMDDGDHGTHVAGTIGAAANDGNPHVGVAWNVQLMACKFLAANGFGATDDAILCIDYAIFNGAQIMNNSWGGGGFSQALFDIIFEAYQRGILFVAAAGNDGLNNDSIPHFPANYSIPNIISVAALDRSDRLAEFSNYGAQSVHLGAPGVEILSSTSRANTDYQSFNGTSMATPHVAGVAALILSHYPAANLNEVVQRLLLGTVPIPSLNGRTTTGGRLNAYNSLTLSGTGVIHATVDPPTESVLLAGSEQPVIARLSDPFSVAGATVTASIPGVTNLTLLDDGQAPDALANDSVYSAMLQVPTEAGSLTMTLIATAPDKVGLTNVLSYDVVPPPANDLFVNAAKVAGNGGIHRSNNRFATREPGEPALMGRSDYVSTLWWTWSAPVTTNVIVDTTGSSIDAILGVFRGNAITNLTLVAQTNSNIGQRRRAYVTFQAQAGTAYRIVVASPNTNSLGTIQLRIAPGGQPDTTPPVAAIVNPLHGTSTTNEQIVISGTAADLAPNTTGVDEVLVKVNELIASSALGTTNWIAPTRLKPGLNRVEVRAVDKAGNFSSIVSLQVSYFPPAPPNDFYVNSAPLSGSNVVASTGIATTEPGEPLHAGNAGGKSVWWHFTPPEDGVLTLDTDGSDFDTLLALYSGTNVGSLTMIASNDDNPEGESGSSRIVQALRSGVTYKIAVDGYDNIGGNVQLTWDFAPATVFEVTATSTEGGSVTPSSTLVPGNATLVLTATPQAYFQFQQWEGAVNSANNPLSLVVNEDMTLTARFVPVEFTDGFESGDLLHLPWGTAGAKPWTVQSTDVAAGQFAARSGNITHNQSSSLVLQRMLRDGTVSFEYRVSSESTFDQLRFFVDGLLKQSWSGNVGWATYSFVVEAGMHTLEWRYSKDGSGTVGADAAFIDNLNLPVTLPVDETTPALLSLQPQSDGSYSIRLVGQTDRVYVLQTSTNLFNWEGVSTHTVTGGSIQIPITLDGPGVTRYYRAVTTP